MKRNPQPHIVVHGDYIDIHDNNFHGGTFHLTDTQKKSSDAPEAAAESPVSTPEDGGGAADENALESPGRGRPQVHLFVDNGHIPTAAKEFDDMLRQKGIPIREMSSRKDDPIVLTLKELFHRWNEAELLLPKARGSSLVEFATTCCAVTLAAEKKTISNVINSLLN